MGTIKLELELDYCGEDYSLEETVQKNIIDRLSEKIIEKNMDKIDVIISEKIVKQLNAEVTKYVKNWLGKKNILITDRYGDVKEKYESMHDLIKKSFNNALNEQVDEKGRISKSSYHNETKTRLAWLVDNKIKGEFQEKLEKKVDDAILEVKNQLQEKIENDIKFNIGKELYSTLNMKKVLIAENKS